VRDIVRCLILLELWWVVCHRFRSEWNIRTAGI